MHATPGVGRVLLFMTPPRHASPVAFLGKERLPQEVVALHASFYNPNEREKSKGAPERPPLSSVAPLWTQLVKAYGDEDLALRAAQQNPTVLNALYTSPPSLIASSKRALVTAMGSEADAVDVMCKNPAVLQCGASLASQPADEIRRFAAVRSLLDNVPPQASLLALGSLLTAGLLNIALKDSSSVAVQDLLGYVRPAVGAVGASIFLATVLNAARAQRDLRGAERQAKGEEGQ